MPAHSANLALFSEPARRRFMEITGSRYDGMAARMAKKKLPALPFTKDQLRMHVMEALGGRPDGVIRCRYCRVPCQIGDIAFDHEVPLARGGGLDLDNIGFPCASCNDRKGKLKPEEYTALLDFLDDYPFARQDVLARLEKATKLAAGSRFNAVRIKELKAAGQWKRPKKSKPVEDF